MRRLLLGALVGVFGAGSVSAMPHTFRFGFGSETIKGIGKAEDKGTYTGLVLGYRHAADNSLYFNAQIEGLAGKTKMDDGSNLTTSVGVGDLDLGYRFAIPGANLSVTPFAGRKHHIVAAKNNNQLVTIDFTLLTSGWKLGGNLAYQVIAPLSLGAEVYYVIPDINEVTVKVSFLGASKTENTELKDTGFLAWAIPVKYEINERWELEGRYGQFQRDLQAKDDASTKTTQKTSEISLTAGYRF
jgi:hypothetical protein